MYKRRSVSIITILLGLLVLGGIAALGWALYGRGGEAVQEEAVTPSFYSGEAEQVFRLENEHLLMEMDGDSTHFTLTSKKDGHVWHSVPVDAAQDPLALAGSKNLLQSTLAITYSTTNGVRTLYDNYEYSIKNQIYTIAQEDNALRVDYTLGRIARAYLIPSVVEVERMNSFLDQMSKSEKRKVLDSYRKYDPAKIKEDQKEELLSKYPQLQDGPIYVIRDKVKDFLKEEFERLFAGVGYTYDDYMADQADTDLTIGSKTAVFNISVIYRLDGSDLLVEVPLQSIRYTSDFPPIRVNILPNFGAGGVSDQGFVLLPEGGGAIMRFNNGKAAQNSYFANIYGWDYASSRDAVVHETGVRFPVFGMANGGSAFLCMMEGQAANASLSADVSGRGNSYNTASASYNLLHSDAFNVTDRTIETIYMYEPALPEGSITQRYRFLPTADPVEMAKAYRAYLLERYPGLAAVEHDGLPLSVEIIGAIDKIQQRGGIPVSAPIRLTSYEEAAGIVNGLKDLPRTELFVRMNGWMNGGVLQTLPKKIKLVNQLGSKRDFDQMVSDIHSAGARLYLHGITSFAVDSGLMEGFLPVRDAARFTTREQVKLFHYSPIWYGAMELRDYYYLLKPSLSIELLDSLANAAKDFGADGVSLEDVGALLSADYNPKATVSRDAVAKMQSEKLEEIAAGSSFIIRGGNLYALEGATLVTDTDLEGTGYAILDEEIPFTQIALHGLVAYTGKPINLSGDWEKELLLSAQRGAGLSFTFMQETPLTLQNTEYSAYYGASYDAWGAKAKELAARYASELGHTFDQAIVQFERVAPGLTVTGYEDGTLVYVNLNDEEMDVSSRSVPARDYLVISGEVTP